MKVDPNQPVSLFAEYILCQGHAITLHDDSRVSLEDLARPENPFADFCRTLDPNRTFVIALIPEDGDREVFFKARDAARNVNIHMQAPIDTPDRLRASWDAYRFSKRHATAPSEANVSTDPTHAEGAPTS